MIDTSKRLIIATTTGNIIEWYDFCLFGYFAPLLAKTFFPQTQSSISLFYVFLIFASGALARPIGGLIFGYIGDSKNYGYALYHSIYWIIPPTVCIGLLPGYAQWGMTAPILLIVARVIQGISAGGQYSGALAFLKKHYVEKGALGSSFMYVGSLLGFLLASCVGMVTTHYFTSSWAWRIPFLLSFLFVFLLKYCKKGLLIETMSTQKLTLKSYFSLLKTYKKLFIKTTLLASLGGVYYFSFFVFLISYLNVHVKMPMHLVLIINTVCLVLSGVLCILFSACADRFGRKPFIRGSCFLLGLLIYPCFQLMNTGGFWLSLSGVLILTSLNTVFFAACAIVFVELFPPKIRYTGTALCYNIGNGIFGGMTPAMLTLIIIHYNYQVMCIALMLCAFLGGIFIHKKIPETLRV